MPIIGPIVFMLIGYFVAKAQCKAENVKTFICVRDKPLE